MRNESLKQRIDDPSLRQYVADLQAKYKYAGTAEEARRAVDKAMGAKRLTDLLYESRRERSV